LAGVNFKCNLQGGRKKMFRSLNGIFGKIGVASATNMTLSLVDTFCIPVLLYGLEAVNLNVSACNKLDYSYDFSLAKKINIKEKRIIKQCQYFSGCLQASCRLALRRLNFYKSFYRSKFSPQHMIFQ